MSKNSLARNATLNAAKAAMSVVFPLVTYPYAFRALGPERIGAVDFSRSVAEYAVMGAALGVKAYAIREASRLRDDRAALERFASEIFTLNLISTLVAYLILVAAVAGFPALRPYAGLIAILSTAAASATMGLEWALTAFEDYAFVTTVSLVTHCASLVALFAFVHGPEDALTYAGLIAASNAATGLAGWFRTSKRARIRPTARPNLRRHLAPVMTMFANTVATGIYVNADSTMLGLMAGDASVGAYSVAVKIYSVVKNVLAAVYGVTIPRISRALADGDDDGVKRTCTGMATFVTAVLLPIAAGLFMTADEVVALMGGEGYSAAAAPLKILSVSLVGAIYGGMITWCLNVSIGRERVNVEATAMAAALNVGLNLFTIPALKQDGAAVTTAIAEFFVFGWALRRTPDVERYVDVRGLAKCFAQCAAGTAACVLACLAVGTAGLGPVASLAAKAACGGAAYLAATLALGNEQVVAIVGAVARKVGFGK